MSVGSVKNIDKVEVITKCGKVFGQVAEALYFFLN